MRLLQWTFPPCRNLWPREHQKVWWGLCISDHVVGSSPIISCGNSLKTRKLAASAPCCNLWFNHVLSGKSLPHHCFEFSSCWLTCGLASSYTGIVSHSPAPCQQRFCRLVSYVPSHFFRLSSLYLFKLFLAQKLSYWVSSAILSSMPCH